MSKELFRKRSMEKIASPEQLTDYIRVANPGVWMVLAAIVILLVGVCVWGIFGQMDTKLHVVVVSENGASACYVRESDIGSVQAGMTVRCEGNTYTLADIPGTPVTADGMDGYAMHVGNIEPDEWVYRITLGVSLPAGIYPAEIVISSVSPISFVVN